MASGESASHFAPAEAPPQRFAFSTEALPERDRLPFFKEELAPLLELDVELLSDDRPRHSVTLVDLGPVALGSIDVTPTAFSRKRRHTRGQDHFFFNPVTTGWSAHIYKGHTTRYDVGEGCFMHLSEAADCCIPDGGTAFGIRIDGAALRALVKRPEDMIGRPIRRGHPGLALLLGYLRSYAEARETMTPQLHHSFGLHIVDLVAAILGTGSDGSEQVKERGVRAARLRQVLDRIASRACDAGFTVETMAGELGVTSRTIQLLLEETGATFSEHVAEHRLRRAWRLLADPASGLGIAEIAYESGFNDLSHFYRAFRRRYSETPAAVRASGTLLH
jgi:AraC-like DNA-binding protein